MDIRAFIKEVGRGRDGARDLARTDAASLFGAMLDGQVSDLQLGAILVAYRIKSESRDELAGFLDAIGARSARLVAPAGRVPVVIPTYNGARQLPNLVPLLASLLARRGLPVLVHGVVDDPGRVTTREVFEAMDIRAAASAEGATAQLRERNLAFLPIEILSPSLARLLALRWQLGVRSSGHTLAKMLQPFEGGAIRGRALRLVSVTHPDYLRRMREFFAMPGAGDALVLRGAEGEVVAHPRRRLEMDWITGDHVETLRLEAQEAEPLLPADKDATVTAGWISEALAGRQPVPPPIAFQVERCVEIWQSMNREAT